MKMSFIDINRFIIGDYNQTETNHCACKNTTRFLHFVKLEYVQLQTTQADQVGTI